MVEPIAIERARCVGCGKCVRGCGFGAMRLTDGKAEVDPSACRACSACVKACPYGAIREGGRTAAGAAEPAGCRDIWVFAEQTAGRIAEVAFELLGKGLELKAQRGEGCRLCAVLLGCGIAEATVAELTAAGADVVYVVDDPKLADYETDVTADAVAQLAAKHRPEVMLAGATAIGRAFFAKVAVRLGTGLTADCTGLKIERRDGRPLLFQTRPAFGGNILATIITPNHRPQMATVRPKVFKRGDVGKPRGCDGGRETSQRQHGLTSQRANVPTRQLLNAVVRERLDLIAPRTRLVKVERNPETVDISTAEVLVAGGRGLKSAQNFMRLFELAGCLGGEVAASRAAVEAGWAAPMRQVGQTGRTVAPKLYLCFGISGAIQHLEGIRGADRIVAVNSDPNAPIFGVANLGIVGDAMDVIEALLERFKTAGGIRP